MVVHRRPLDALALARVPALVLDVAGQQLVLEPFPGARRQAHPPRHDLVAEQAPPAIEQHQHRPLLGRQHLGVPLRWLGAGIEAEPVEPVRVQRQQVRQLADRRERRAAEHLDGHPAAEA
jgi:hypothetical protein